MAKKSYDRIIVEDDLPSSAPPTIPEAQYCNEAFTGGSPEGTGFDIRVFNTSRHNIHVIHPNKFVTYLKSNLNNMSNKVLITATYRKSMHAEINWQKMVELHPKEEQAFLEEVKRKFEDNTAGYSYSPREIVLHYEIDVSEIEHFTDGIWVQHLGVQLVSDRTIKFAKHRTQSVFIGEAELTTDRRSSHSVTSVTEYVVHDASKKDRVIIETPLKLIYIEPIVDTSREEGLHVYTLGDSGSLDNGIVDEYVFIPEADFKKRGIFRSKNELKNAMNKPTKDYSKADIDRLMSKLENSLDGVKSNSEPIGKSGKTPLIEIPLIGGYNLKDFNDLLQELLRSKTLGKKVFEE